MEEVGPEEKSAKEVAAEVVSSWLHDLYLTHPLAVSEDQLKDLIKKGLIEDPDDRRVREGDEIIAQQIATVAAADRYPLSIEEYLGRCPAEWHAEWRDKEIKSAHWRPPSGDHFDQDFRDFISSTHQRFCDMKPYKAFFLYIMQARRWSADSVLAEDYPPGYERERFQVTELSRFRANSLYFCNKYGHVKESGMGDKGRKYDASLAHCMILFLLDCGRCFLALKGRQMAFTSTVALWMVCRMITRPNYAIKFVAQDKDKTEEIFEDKVKHSFSVLDDWMKPRVTNNRDQWFRVSFTSDSDKGSATNSSGIRVVAPKADAVNGGSPDFVGMDEQAYTPLFRKMLKEGRPALKVMDPQTKERRLTRQATAWTTGGEDDRGNGEFEDEYRSVLGHWQQACATGIHNDFFFPVFMDWTCIPGATLENYEKEKRAAAAGTAEGMADKSIEERMIIFRQQWPSSIEDGFLSNVPTLIPLPTILKRLDDIDDLQIKLRTQYNAPIYQKGRFVPVLGDRAMPDGMWYSKNIIGTQWVPSSDSDYRAPISILTGGHPKRNWKWRYYQGTDPVQHDSGHSLQSSFMWDAQWGMPVAVCNGRFDDPNLMHEQVALMGMYYAEEGQHFTPHLIENNMGTGYIDFVSSAFFERGRNSMVNNNRLPDFLQGGGTDIGLRMTARTKYEVINRLKALAIDHGHKILFRSVWNQLQHFTQTHGGDVPKWKSSDPEKFPDDQLIALPLSYICRLCFSNRTPVEIDSEKEQKRNQAPSRILSRDATGELDYVYQRA